MPVFDRATAYHEAAQVAVWQLEEGMNVGVVLDAKNPHVIPDGWRIRIETRHEGVRRAYVRMRAGLAGAFAEYYLLGDSTVWLPTMRDAAPVDSDLSAIDWHTTMYELNRAMQQHTIEETEADALYDRAVAELTSLFQDRAFTDRVRRIGDYLAIVERRLFIDDEELRAISDGINDEHTSQRPPKRTDMDNERTMTIMDVGWYTLVWRPPGTSFQRARYWQHGPFETREQAVERGQEEYRAHTGVKVRLLRHEQKPSPQRDWDRGEPLDET